MSHIRTRLKALMGRKRKVLTSCDAWAKSERHLYLRFGSYLLGFLLFYTPASIFVRLFYGAQGQHLTGNVCDSLNLRMGAGALLKPEFWERVIAAEPRSLGIFVVILVAFFLGPLFCGWLCAAGAVSESLSRLVPARFQIDIAGKVNAGAIRYGFLAGFVTLPFFGLATGCAYCNYRLLDYLGIAMTAGFIPALSSTYFVVIALWLVAGGLFMKGGRGWCNFLCPVGAVQNLFYGLGTRLGFTFKLKYLPEKCKSCPNCVEVCPMRAISMAAPGQWPTGRGPGVLVNPHSCITCNQCIAACPHGALTYDTGRLQQPLPVPARAAAASLPSTATVTDSNSGGRNP